MTIVDDAGTGTAWTLGAPRLLAGVEQLGRVDHAHHRAVHGAPTPRSRGWLSQALKDVNLLGRGGAAFPVGLKLDAMPKRGPMNVLVNGSESEPASRKDCVLMTAAPHLVIDGALVVAGTLDADAVTIVVHDAAAHDSLVRAVHERVDAAGIQVVRTHDGFVGGEIRAVVNGLTTGTAKPGGRRELPHVRGVGRRPSFASNVETFAQIAILAARGATEYAGTGSTDEPGTSLVTLVGDVARPGVVEVPNGTPLQLLLPGRPDAPVLVGGYHGTWVRRAHDLVLNREALRTAGAPLGAGVVARPFDGTCVLAEVAGVSRWLAGESLGQCGPCFFGLPALAADMQAFADGVGSDEQVRRRLGQVTGRGACAHPDGAVRFMASALGALADDVEVHRHHGSCGRPASSVLPLPTPRRTR